MDNTPTFISFYYDLRKNQNLSVQGRKIIKPVASECKEVLDGLYFDYTNELPDNLMLLDTRKKLLEQIDKILNSSKVKGQDIKKFDKFLDNFYFAFKRTLD